MKSQLFVEISTFSRKVIIFSLLPHSPPVDPHTQNPLYSTHVVPQTPNSFYSALAEPEHKTWGRVKISVSWKNLCSKRDLSKTIDWTQGRQTSKLEARGKPSTRLPRGRHVETERITHRKDEHAWRTELLSLSAALVGKGVADLITPAPAHDRDSSMKLSAKV